MSVKKAMVISQKLYSMEDALVKVNVKQERTLLAHAQAMLKDKKWTDNPKEHVVRIVVPYLNGKNGTTKKTKIRYKFSARALKELQNRIHNSKNKNELSKFDKKLEKPKTTSLVVNTGIPISDNQLYFENAIKKYLAPVESKILVLESITHRLDKQMQSISEEQLNLLDWGQLIQKENKESVQRVVDASRRIEAILDNQSEDIEVQKKIKLLSNAEKMMEIETSLIKPDPIFSKNLSIAEYKNIYGLRLAISRMIDDLYPIQSHDQKVRVIGLKFIKAKTEVNSPRFTNPGVILPNFGEIGDRYRKNHGRPDSANTSEKFGSTKQKNPTVVNECYEDYINWYERLKTIYGERITTDIKE
jgi:hypothetical protein